MPEYRRFIAYFYEYIDGKKEKNAGFAKVELRNGMWRILFRLTCQALPEPPLQVFGFVRVQGRLLGILMGTMYTARKISEEWAYQAGQFLGDSLYRLEDLAGIWVQSGDGRIFLTVWDDEAADPGKFVLKLPEAEEAADAGAITEETPGESENKMGEETAGAARGAEPEAAKTQAAEKELWEEAVGAARGAEPEAAKTRVVEKELWEEAVGAARRVEPKEADASGAERELGKETAGASGAELELGKETDRAEPVGKPAVEYMEMKESPEKRREAESGLREEVSDAVRRVEPKEAGASEAEREMRKEAGVPGFTESGMGSAEKTPGFTESGMEPAEDSAGTWKPPIRLAEARELSNGTAERNAVNAAQAPEAGARRSVRSEDEITALFKKRPHFQPFSDDEIGSCIMIMPCDIVRLQQEKWKVGRSSFLQHGFYQHRHLLLGKAGDGSYVLGVPGLRNSQEKYMAEMFGFDRFKLSGSWGCGRPFGYWYRILEKEGSSSADVQNCR